MVFHPWGWDEAGAGQELPVLCKENHCYCHHFLLLDTEGAHGDHCQDGGHQDDVAAVADGERAVEVGELMSDGAIVAICRV